VAGAQHFTDLVVWQPADQLRVHVFRATARPPLRTDFKLRSQLADAADSVCRNIAEGFGAQSNREFARFRTDLLDARRLLRRLYPAIGSLLAHGIVAAIDALVRRDATTPGEFGSVAVR
jgi:ethanolamine ammonia-lyase small subunit